MANTKAINDYGASIVTCDRHVAREKNLYGIVAREVTTDVCQDCETERRHAEAPAIARAALLDPKCTHTRSRNWCGVEVISIYHRDPTSPSGVIKAAGLDAARFEIVYKELIAQGLISSSKSPLSPTEML